MNNIKDNISKQFEHNMSIHIDKCFNPKSFIFSNNDAYMGVIGKNSLLLIESRTGNVIH